MITGISNFSIVVPDQEEALRFYTEKLGFEKRLDISTGSGKRWVTVAPISSTIVFVLQPLDWFEEGEERDQRKRLIGKAPTTVLKVDDCYETCSQLEKRGVTIVDPPADSDYGIQAVITDLYGNNYVLMQEPDNNR